MAKKFVQEKIDRLLDELAEHRQEITVDTVAQAWKDRWGCRFQPHAHAITSVMRRHPKWNKMGNLKKGVWANAVGLKQV